MDNVDTVSILIACALFVVNLIIILVVNNKDKKSRDFRNHTQQIKNFRSEFKAAEVRMHDLTQDCTDGVQSHIDKARDTVEIVNSCLDRLSQHQKDLTALEGICIDYKRALEKLKLQTDQAESRILVVQAEIRKAESVSDFVKNFHSESEMLEHQLSDLKSEYLRLVTSTQESLKQQAALQRNENGEMLTAFNAAIERQKQTFMDFVNDEKQGFAHECEDQARIAAQATEQMAAGKREVDDAVRNASSSVATMRDGIRLMLDQANEDASRFKDEVRASFDGFRDDIGGEGESLRASFAELEANLEKASVKIDEKTQACALSLTGTFEDLSQKMDRRREEIAMLVQEKESALSSSMERKASEIRDRADETIQDLDEKIVEMKKERDEYGASARISYREALYEEMEKANQSYDKISKLVSSQIDLLAERAREMNDTISVLSEKEISKLSDAGMRLTDLSEKIRESEGTLSRIQETVTAEREELYRLQGDHEAIDKELRGAKEELSSTKADIASAREKSIRTEAELGRLNLEKEKVKAEQDREKEEQKKKKKEEERAESLFEEFPDEFLGEEEEISLDD